MSRIATAAGLVIVAAALIGTLVHHFGSLSATGDVIDAANPGNAAGDSDTGDTGTLPDGVTVFDDEYAGITNLDPDLLDALREAATDAGEGVEFAVNSGWRSTEYQEDLLSEAVAEYGSEDAAARWVATPETSSHVSGDAVDLASDAAAWLSEHGARYGLCQIYRNEPWHYELRQEAITGRCPRMYADPTDDPRLQP